MDLKLLDETLSDLGQPKFRRDQIWEWVCEGASSYAEMTNLPEKVRSQLIEKVPFSTLTVAGEARSTDGTLKTLFHTHDGRPIEAVLMRYRDGRSSICVSSQSGCPLTCTFCATGSMKFGRNLTSSEILDQVLHFRRKTKVTHLVFMGMGEPTMNIEAVLESCEYLPSIGIAPRRTTVSTVGWVPGIKALTESESKVRLALSLHAPNSKLRSKIMPVNDRYDIDEVLAACFEHYKMRRKKVYIEYVMLEGVNDQAEVAVELAELLDPKIYKVNLIPYNPTGSIYGATGKDQIAVFKDILMKRGLVATVRLTRGQDIAAACGQLAADQAKTTALQETLNAA